MNRRSIFKLLATIPFIGVPAITAETKKGIVEVLDIREEETKYKTIKEFTTEQEAIAFVHSLIPEIVEVHVRESKGPNYIRSGYRGAIRYMTTPEDTIVSTSYGIRSKLTGEWVDIAPKHMWLYSAEFAWLLLSNIRVNGKPVHQAKKGLPNIMIMPFQKGDAKIIRVGPTDLI